MNFKQILYESSKNKIFLSGWLENQGIDRKIAYSYKKNGWIRSLGRGAFIKKDALPILDYGIEALQTQLFLPVHIGGKSTLSERYNIRQFIKYKKIKIELFVPNKTVVPFWFKSIFQDKYVLITTDFLPQNIGLEIIESNDLKLKISSPERSFLELLYSVPKDTSTKEAYQIIELLLTLRPKLLMELLTQCKSVKVKRLFLFLASKVKHDWLDIIDITKIDLGSGIRSIDKKGIYNKDYKLVVDNIGDI